MMLQLLHVEALLTTLLVLWQVPKATPAPI